MSTENTEKKKISKNNTSGHTGVYFNSKGYWLATWRTRNIQHSKSFSVKKYGYDNAKNLAIEFRQIKVPTSPEFIHYSKIPELSPSKFKELSNKSELTDLENLSIEKFKFQLSLMNNTNISVNNEEKIWHHF